MLALRKQLEASEISLKAEQGAKAGAERRAEQVPLLPSMAVLVKYTLTMAILTIEQAQLSLSMARRLTIVYLLWLYLPPSRRSYP